MIELTKGKRLSAALDGYLEALQVNPIETPSSEMTMDEKIKAKAQEVRLVLLEALHEEAANVNKTVRPADRSSYIQELASILNALDPGAHGIGSYGTLLASAEEIAPPSLKLGDVVRVDGVDMAVNLISAGPDGEDVRHVRVELIPAASSGVGGYSTK